MPELPDIPPIQVPPAISIACFVAIIFYVVVGFVWGVRFGNSSVAPKNDLDSKSSFAWWLLAWLIFATAIPLSGVLRWKVLPPPGFAFVFVCVLAAVLFTFSKFGKSLSSMPLFVLAGFHIFRFPLELILHYWYHVKTIPIQMTYEGYNFDIVTGILAAIVFFWGKFGSPPRVVYWLFNIAGLALLLTVFGIAITSVPSPIQQFTNEPPLLLPFYFPYSYIASVAVAGALAWHLVMFRKLISTGKNRV